MSLSSGTRYAKWKSTTHIDIVGRRFDIWFDEAKIMEDGKFLI